MTSYTSHLISYTNISGDVFSFILSQICCAKVNIFCLVQPLDFVHSTNIQLSWISVGNFSQPAEFVKKNLAEGSSHATVVAELLLLLWVNDTSSLEMSFRDCYTFTLLTENCTLLGCQKDGIAFCCCHIFLVLDINFSSCLCSCHEK